jgi:hypothetical protein
LKLTLYLFGGTAKYLRILTQVIISGVGAGAPLSRLFFTVSTSAGMPRTVRFSGLASGPDQAASSLSLLCSSCRPMVWISAAYLDRC